MSAALKPSYIAYYRKNKDNQWNLYIKGQIITTTVDNPQQDQQKRFPNAKLYQNGPVMFDVATF